jgi:L-amino acid N-acyltransferase YncA
VRKNFRKSGVSLGLYQAYKKWYSDSFDYLITDIVFENQPSLKAHQKAGFEIVSELNYSGSHWAVVLWNWN